MKQSATLTFFALVAVTCSCAQSPATVEPYFASRAAYVYPRGSATSPDGKKLASIRVLDDSPDSRTFPSAEVTARTPRGSLRSRIQFGLNAQILWSDDSSAFAITGSAEGGNGQYQTSAFLIRGGRLVRVPLTRLVERAFGHPVKCGWPEPPNVEAVKWLKGSTRLLVAAEIIGHTNCDSMGTFKGFVIDLQSAQVVRGYNQIEVKRLFGADLAPELRDANDSCILDPPTCYVSSNHPELKRSSQ